MEGKGAALILSVAFLREKRWTRGDICSQPSNFIWDTEEQVVFILFIYRNINRQENMVFRLLKEFASIMCSLPTSGKGH